MQTEEQQWKVHCEKRLAYVLIAIVLFPTLYSPFPAKCQQITIVSGDQFVLALRLDDPTLVDVTHTIIVISNASHPSLEINASYQLPAAARIYGGITVDHDPRYFALNLSQSSESKYSISSRIVNLQALKVYTARLTYVLGGVIRKVGNDKWHLDFTFQSRQKGIEVVMKIPKPIYQVESISFSDLLPTPDYNYEESSYYVFAWRSSLLSDSPERAIYYLSLTFAKSWNYFQIILVLVVFPLAAYAVVEIVKKVHGVFRRITIKRFGRV